eukprot:1141073-Pelagomonas_calceolata.AAC.1
MQMWTSTASNFALHQLLELMLTLALLTSACKLVFGSSVSKCTFTSKSALLPFKSALESAYKAHAKRMHSVYKARSVPKHTLQVRARLFGARKRALQTKSAQVQG